MEVIQRQGGLCTRQSQGSLGMWTVGSAVPGVLAHPRVPGVLARPWAQLVPVGFLPVPLGGGGPCLSRDAALDAWLSSDFVGT